MAYKDGVHLDVHHVLHFGCQLSDEQQPIFSYYSGFIFLIFLRNNYFVFIIIYTLDQS